MIIFKTNLLQTLQRDSIDFKQNIFITIDTESGKIVSVSENISPDSSYINYSNFLLIPGLIDTHVHLSQYFIRGKQSPNLIEWLNKYVFAEEYKSRNKEYSLSVTSAFFKDMIKSGTTTAAIYTNIFKESADIAFQLAERIGIRALIGKVMMDVNCPDFLMEDTEESFYDSVELFEKWNNKSKLLDYVFTPRFAPVCTPKLMKKIGDFASKNDAFIQTHLSENWDEINWIKKLFPNNSNYTQVYNDFGLLGEKSILGHAIHLNNNEFDLLKKTNSKIAHCPESNFFLKSGRFNWNKISRSEIDFGLASDVGAGTILSMLNSMKMASFRQDLDLIELSDIFYSATLGAAKVLSKEKLIGSIEMGKEADLVFISGFDFSEKTGEEILSELIFLWNEKTITSVYVSGNKLL
jgi:guanine deaminase